MSTNEELNKSIDDLLEDVFAESETPVVEKSIDIKQDSNTTADAVMASVPKSEKDESRGAGRPKQISDVPQMDMDGKREGEYDGSISEDSGAKEPEETKQSKSPDSDRPGAKSPAPKSPPFRKSDDEDDQAVTIGRREFDEYQALKKAQTEKAEADAKAQELKKMEQSKKDQEDLVKSAVRAETESLRKSLEDMRKTNEEQATLLKAMASQPVRAKSIVGIEQLEKSSSKEAGEPETFTKSEILDVAADLVMKGKLPDVVVSEIEMTGRVSDPSARKIIEQALEGKR